MQRRRVNVHNVGEVRRSLLDEASIPRHSVAAELVGSMLNLQEDIATWSEGVGTENHCIVVEYITSCSIDSAAKGLIDVLSPKDALFYVPRGDVTRVELKVDERLLALQ